MSVQKLVTSLSKKVEGTSYVGEKDRIFFDLPTKTFRISDGVTAGGLILQSNGGGGGNGSSTRIIAKRDNNDTSVAVTSSTPTVITGMTYDVPDNVQQLVNFNSHFTVNTTSSETAQSKTDLVALYDRLVALTATVTDHAATHGSETLGPGVYTQAGAMNITGTLTLNGSATDLFVFRCAGAFTTSASAEVILTGGAVSSNVWIIAEGDASTGASTVFKGNIMANNAEVSTGASTSLEGRMLTISGAVSIGAASIVTAPTGTSVQALGTLDSFNLFTGTGTISTTGTDTTVALGIGTNSGDITGFVVANVAGNIVPGIVITLGGAPNIAEFHVGVYIDGVLIPDSIRTFHRSADQEGSEHPIVLQTVADISTEGQTIDIRAHSTLGTCTVGPGMIMVLTPIIAGDAVGGDFGLTGIDDFTTGSVVELTDTTITITGSSQIQSDEAADPVIKSEYVLYGTTVNATVTELYRDTFNNKIILSPDTTYFYEIDVIGRGNTGNDHAAIQFTGAIDVDSVGFMHKINEQRTTLTSGPGFDLDAAIGLTSQDNSLNISGSGRAGSTVRWTALAKLIEVKQI